VLPIYSDITGAGVNTIIVAGYQNLQKQVTFIVEILKLQIWWIRKYWNVWSEYPSTVRNHKWNCIHTTYSLK